MKTTQNTILITGDGSYKTTTMNTQLKQRLVFALLMGMVTTGVVSLTLASINIGFMEGFLKIWIRSWGTAYAVVLPAIIFVGPRVQSIVNWLVK